VGYLHRIAAAQAFFRTELSTCLPRWPRKITLDGRKQSHLALRLLRRTPPAAVAKATVEFNNATSGSTGGGSGGGGGGALGALSLLSMALLLVARIGRRWWLLGRVSPRCHPAGRA
jgi:hypothetical protein